MSARIAVTAVVSTIGASLHRNRKSIGVVSFVAFVIAILSHFILPELVGEQGSKVEMVLAQNVAARRLVVLTHGFTGDFSKLRPLQSEMARHWPDADYLLYQYDARRWSNIEPMAVGADLETRIESVFDAAGGRYDSVVLVGHSVGGLIVRQAYVLGLGVPDDESLAKGMPAAWARKVQRIILLAAPNRGSAITTRNPLIRFADLLARIGGVSRFIQATYRGMPFVVNLRLAWIEAVDERVLAQQQIAMPLIVQVLGNRDGLVNDEDSIDLVQMPRFAKLRVLGATHAGVIDVSDEAVRNAVKDALSTQAVVMTKPAGVEPRSRIVFIRHGIRDYGDWIDEVKSAVMVFDPRAEVSTKSIGYFTIANFISPFARRRMAEDFADYYAEMRAVHRDAEFDFAGHSFGTYLLGASLQRYHRIRFHRAYLAGSVLPRDYRWDVVAQRKQIAAVRNDVAQDDVPVGVLAHFLSTFFDDCGSAGANAFTQSHPWLEQNKYLRGGHGAAFFRENYSSIARFLTGTAPATLTASRLSDAELERVLQQSMIPKRERLWETATNFATPLCSLVLLSLGGLLGLLVVKRFYGIAAVITGVVLLLLHYF